MPTTICKVERNQSTISLKETSNRYIDIVTGSVNTPEESQLVIEIKFEGSTFNLDPDNYLKFVEYCYDTSNIDKDSWVYADPDVINNKGCISCDTYIANVETGLLLSMQNKTGTQLLCQDCSHKLSYDVDSLPTEEILSRQI